MPTFLPGEQVGSKPLPAGKGQVQLPTRRNTGTMPPPRPTQSGGVVGPAHPAMPRPRPAPVVAAPPPPNPMDHPGNRRAKAAREAARGGGVVGPQISQGQDVAQKARQMGQRKAMMGFDRER